MKRLLLSGLVLTAVVSAWGPPERVDRKPDNYVTYDNDIKVSRDGTPFIVWSECKRETYFEKVMFARRDHDTWTIPVNVSRDSGDLRQPTITLDRNGMPIVVWTEYYTGRVRFVRFLGDSWSIPKLCFSTHYGWTPVLVTAPDGRVHLQFEKPGAPGVIWHSYYIPEADSWAKPCTVAYCPSDPLGWSDLTADRNSHLHSVWMDYSTYGVGYAYNDGTGWSEPVQLPDPSRHQSCSPRIVCDSFCRPHVVWQEYSGGYPTYYTYFNGDSWSAPLRLFSPGRPQICLDSFNLLQIIAGTMSYFVRVVRLDTAWSQVESLYPGGLFSFAVSRELIHLLYSPSDFCLYYRCGSLLPGVEENGSEPNRCFRPIGFGSLRFVEFELDYAEDVVIKLFESTGRCATRFYLGRMGAGRHRVRILDNSPGSGVRFVVVEAGKRVAGYKCILVR